MVHLEEVCCWIDAITEKNNKESSKIIMTKVRRCNRDRETD